MPFFSKVSLLLISLCLAQAVAAQQSAPISPSVVLVLKLVSSTLVKPTTGIVVSDDGLVLVPADFVLTEGEMIVLDGGGDIISNGRPAMLVAQAVPGELAVLSVTGLKRPGFTLSNKTLSATNSLHLEAFPPAEYIAKGAQPLWLPVDMQTDEMNLQQGVSIQTPLPYVSGAIIDACGYLTGVSLTSGAQSLDTDKTTLILLGEKFSRVLDAMQITLPSASCEISMQQIPLQQAETPAIKPDYKAATADTTKPAEPVSEPGVIEPEVIEPAVLETPEPSVNETGAAPSGGLVLEPAQRRNTSKSEPPSVWQSVPLWLVLSGVIILGVLIWKALFFFRLSKSAPVPTTPIKFTSHVQPASDEPVTAPLETLSDSNLMKPRAAPVFESEIQELGACPDGYDGLLIIEGKLDADTAFKRFCFVNTGQINVIIGRGDADINIEHAAISRAHARLESVGEMLTISDLASRNGCFIGDIPCLPGEILFVKADDEIYLGDVKLRVRVVKQVAEWA